MSLPVVDAPIKFHLSLNVSNLGRSVAFYYQLFGVQPAKSHEDYAKFELEDPPVIFSLVPHAPGTGGVLSHIGFRVADDEALNAFRERIEAAGLCVEEQCDTVCGYARQNKCWVKDPDGNFCEIYCIEEDIDPVILRRGPEGPAARVEQAAGPEAWEHYVSHPFPERIPHQNNTLDEVRLTGTFNASADDRSRQALVQEAVRVLKPGGKVVVHGLMGNGPLSTQPKLPGLAALVAHVPAQSEPLQVLKTAGFTGLQVVKYTEQPWFLHESVELREVKIIAWKPAAGTSEQNHQVLYKGPFEQATSDCGLVFRLGQRVSVPENVWQELRLGSAAEQFLFLEPAQNAGCSIS